MFGTSTKTHWYRTNTRNNRNNKQNPNGLDVQLEVFRRRRNVATGLVGLVLAVAFTFQHLHKTKQRRGIQFADHGHLQQTNGKHGIAISIAFAAGLRPVV